MIFIINFSTKPVKRSLEAISQCKLDLRPYIKRRFQQITRIIRNFIINRIPELEKETNMNISELSSNKSESLIGLF